MRLLIALLSLTLAGTLGPAREAAAQGPIKVGFLAPPSGAIAQADKNMYSTSVDDCGRAAAALTVTA